MLYILATTFEFSSWTGAVLEVRALWVSVLDCRSSHVESSRVRLFNKISPELNLHDCSSLTVALLGQDLHEFDFSIDVLLELRLQELGSSTVALLRSRLHEFESSTDILIGSGLLNTRLFGLSFSPSSRLRSFRTGMTPFWRLLGHAASLAAAPLDQRSLLTGASRHKVWKSSFTSRSPSSREDQHRWHTNSGTVF